VTDSAPASKPHSSATIESLRKSEEIFKLLVDATPDYAIFALDPEGYVATWNKGAERLKGYSEREIVGQHFSKFYTAENLARNHPPDELRLALKNGRYEEEGWRVRKDGTRFWANVVLTPLRNRDSQIIGFSKVTRDLTERRAAEEAKREEEEKFRLMVESVKDYAILMLDPQGRVSSWNEGARRFKGYEAHEIMGHHFSEFYPAEDIRARKPEMELEIAKVTGRFEDEGWRVRKDGTRFWANVVITALFNRHKKLVGFGKVTRDLSERKKSEEALQAAYEGLEVKIKEKTSQLEEALNSRDEFLSIASHELKTPITGMKMQLQMALHRLQGPSDAPMDIARQRKSLEVAANQLNRLTLLIEDLLDISKIQTGKLSFEFQKTNFSHLFQEVLEGFAEQLSNAKTEVSTYIDETLEGYWDAPRIEQVFVNLLSNALKYAPGSKIVVFAKQQEQDAFITIQDFGPGIPEGARKKLFGRFERLGQTRSIGGLGLGLYISRQIVLGHGGEIAVKPGDEIGTTFMIKLPQDPRPHQAAKI
jgi:PAS domain S-box-containing protein